ncbi:hypothetical protein BB559_004282 [Furculomyces boomerangus]|uniref:Acetyltransferase n=2 Tax=Harpellales TaxID=61421 RepID=A0A2T9YFL2_9FUNG|nr:hypothetical protein BB559_006491 [Furculomyces boomerangus]PVU91137.1 hypothetical protein BB559_004282 [Furculomyces boomerangus]PWA01474.1 hypothetical protein BB558_002441 [Smittium angustum]
MEKTDREIMFAGELSSFLDPKLLELRKQVRILNAELQETQNNDTKRIAITKEILGTSDDTTYLEKNAHFDYGVNTHVGKNFYMNANCVILDGAHVDIGNNVTFGPNVQIYTASHPLEAAARNSGLEVSKPIKIGNNVRVGGGAIILPGVTIGDNAVIGFGALVTKDVPANVLVVGNPAKIVKN